MNNEEKNLKQMKNEIKIKLYSLPKTKLKVPNKVSKSKSKEDVGHVKRPLNSFMIFSMVVEFKIKYKVKTTVNI